jgi:hypothetical protein
MTVCGFCKGGPVGNAATWVDGKPRPPAPCPRCGETHPERVSDAADRLFMHGILDEIADDAMHGTLDARDAHADAETIARIVLNPEQTDA